MDEETETKEDEKIVGDEKAEEETIEEESDE